MIVATEGNNVFSLDAATGAVVWQTALGTPVDGKTLPCGNIDPSGITGTPVIDTESGTIYVVAFLSVGPHHELFALDLATGVTRWHLTVDSARAFRQGGATAGGLDSGGWPGVCALWRDGRRLR